MFKYAEMLMAEEDDKVCELIFKQHIQETSLTERKTSDILQKETLA